MAGWLLFMALVLIALATGFAGARQRRWRRWLAVMIAASLPLQFWLVMGIREEILWGDGLIRLKTESGRFGFYMGLLYAVAATPIWMLIGLLGLRVGEALRYRRTY